MRDERDTADAPGKAGPVDDVEMTDADPAHPLHHAGPITVVLNPAAGGGRAPRLWRRVEPELRRLFGDRLELNVTRAPGEAAALAAEAARRGSALILSAGGDGTLHEVVNGLLATDAHVTLGVLPVGSGNDFARGLGIPLHPVAAARALGRALVRRVDAGRVETGGGTHYFVNTAGAGFDAEVAAEVNRAGKATRGALPYVAGVLRTLLRYQNAPLYIEADGQRIRQVSLLAAVGVAPYTGGGMHLLPGADPGDGLFDLCLAGDLSRWEVLGLLPRVFRGSHVNHPKVRMLRAGEVRIDGPATLHVYADGEVLGRLPARFSCLAGRLRVLAPAGA